MLSLVSDLMLTKDRCAPLHASSVIEGNAPAKGAQLIQGANHRLLATAVPLPSP
jgi:hypothetical protein